MHHRSFLQSIREASVKRTVLLVSTLFGIATGAHSETGSGFHFSLGSGAIAGIGVASCASLSENTSPGVAFEDAPLGPVVVAWAQGFLSGINASNVARHRNRVDLSGGRAAELWSAIVTGCRASPEKSLGTVAADFYAQHMR